MDIIKKFYVVNSFTYNGHGGNAAGVFIHKGDLDDCMMQKIARQLNLIETVYISKSDEQGIDFNIRYFTPESEVQIAAHPTIAAFIAIAKESKLNLKEKDKYLINTKNGIKEVIVEEQEKDVFIKLSQRKPKLGVIIEEKNKVAKVLGIDKEDIVDDLPIQCVDSGLGHIIVPIKSLNKLMCIKRNIEQLKALCNFYGVREVQAFCFETKDKAFDIHTRNICPREGIEDVACGIGNAALGAYLLNNYYTNAKSISIKAEQGHIIKIPCQIDIDVSYTNEDDIQIQIGGTGKIIIEGNFIVSNI